MKYLLSIIFLLFALSIQAQTAGDFFNRAARSYVKTEKEDALKTVNQGLSKYPEDQKLKALKEKLEQDQEKEQNQNQQQQNQQNQEQQQQNQQSQGEEGQQQESKDQGEKTDQDKAKNLTPEQAAQILESMNAAELRYIQQNKKKPTQRPKRGIPDW